jgi:hypothetical protein
MALSMQDNGMNKLIKLKEWASELMSMAPSMRDFSWTERPMGMEDIYLTTNTKFMLGNGKMIINRVTENKNAKKQKCDTSGNSITIGSTEEGKSCTKMDQLLQVYI